MGIREIVDGVKGFVSKQAESREDIPDDETRDNYLRSLRRQRRVQREEIEKVRLKKEIANFEHNRTKEYLFGMKGKQPPPKQRKKFPPKKTGTWLGKSNFR